MSLITMQLEQLTACIRRYRRRGMCRPAGRFAAGLSLGAALVMTVLPEQAAFAQNVGRISPPDHARAIAPTGLPEKNRRASSELINLQNQAQGLAVTQHDGLNLDTRGDFVLIDATATESAESLLSDLRALGLVGGTAMGNLVSGRLPVSAIGAAENLPALQFIRLAQPVRRVGSANNQGDVALRTDAARTMFGVDGSGISVGILSDSYNRLNGEAADIASGDLPSGVIVLDDSAGFSGLIDEGRAMAQLIYDIAPNAQLLFHTAFNGSADFAQGILDLAAAGADVIVDDVGYLAAPMFQDGVVAQAVDQVVGDGVVYFSSAGNTGDNSYEAPWLDSGLTYSAIGATYTSLHAFDSADPTGADSVVQEFSLGSGQRLNLTIQWDQPFASVGGAGSSSDIDAFLIDLPTGTIIAGSADANMGADAVERVVYQNNTGVTQVVGLIIGVYQGPVPGRVKWINFGSDVIPENATHSSTVFAHPNAAGAIAVGAAAYVQTPAFGQTPPLIESFSSLGGLELLFDLQGNALSTPDNRDKPDITAPDGVDTTFFSSGDFDNTGFPNFFGTSAAAPNAAAVAALQLDCNPMLTPADIRDQQTGHAIDMATSGFDNISGAGLLDGLATLSAACSCASASYDLPHQQWRMISIPCKLPANADTVELVFGDDGLGVYVTDWTLFEYNALENRYHRLALGDPLQAGRAYWIIQMGANEARTLTLPAGSTPGATNRDSSDPACQSGKGCLAIPLATIADATQWQMLGNPFAEDVMLDDMRVQTSAATNPVDCSAGNGCTLPQSETSGQLFARLFAFDGTIYQVLLAGNSLPAWQGFWANSGEEADSATPELLVPKP